jgi:hypothetical protein
VIFRVYATRNPDKLLRYPGQQIHVIAIEDYVYLVPFIESEEEVFLKTIIPSRKATKKYRGASND